MKYLIGKILQNGGIEHLLHKNIRTILIKKKENADTQKELRPIFTPCMVNYIRKK